MLPTDVETDKAKANFEDDILTISLLKAEAVCPKTVTVKAKYIAYFFPPLQSSRFEMTVFR